MKENDAIEIRNMTKSFRVDRDRDRTLKEIVIRHRKKSKPEVHVVLKNINLDIHKGETVGLIGTNGSGKSTLLKLMTKIIYPNAGTIDTNGKLTSLLELGAGFHEDFTGRENIYFNASIFGLTKEEIDQRVDDIIAFSELGEFIDVPVRTYSSGMYMRLAFSVAINVDADILLFDEILAVGDQHFQDKCFDKLKELRDSKKTIVIVSHSLSMVKELCSRAVWLYKGEFRLDGDPTYVISEYLKQIKIDSKEEYIRKVQKKIDQYHGIIFVDSPHPYTKISKTAPTFALNGWCISDCLHDKLIVRLDQDEIPLDHKVKRDDVLMAYEDQYGSYATNDEECGFCYVIDAGSYEAGEHQVTLTLLDDHGKKITEQQLSIVLGQEQI